VEVVTLRFRRIACLELIAGLMATSEMRNSIREDVHRWHGSRHQALSGWGGFNRVVPANTP
jgi:hypothetical protein